MLRKDKQLKVRLILSENTRNPVLWCRRPALWPIMLGIAQRAGLLQAHGGCRFQIFMVGCGPMGGSVSRVSLARKPEKDIIGSTFRQQRALFRRNEKQVRNRKVMNWSPY
jgi:hypothetical protein